MKINCWCGAPMKFAGRGKFPYDCAAKDKFPDALVWQGCARGHTGWVHEASEYVYAQAENKNTALRMRS